ncbi:MAG: hypothetical protein ACI31G_04140 [Bacilli bacterium]
MEEKEIKKINEKVEKEAIENVASNEENVVKESVTVTNTEEEKVDGDAPSNEETTNNEEVVATVNNVKLVREKEPEVEIGKQVSVKGETITNLDDIENERLTFYTDYKKRQKRSNILAIVVVAFIALIAFFIFSGNDVLKIIGWVIAGLLILGMILNYALFKRKTPDLTQKYIEKINKLSNAYVFGLSELKDTVSDSLEKMPLSEIIADKVYVNLVKIGSRNIVYGAYKESHFKVCDLALYTHGEKQEQKAAFVGKYITYPNSLKFDGRIIINVCGEKPMDLPTDILDLEKKFSEDSLTIYAPEGLDYKDVIKEKFLNKLKKIELKDHLLNINVVLWGGHSAVFLSYDDTVISLPFDKEYDQSSIKQYRNNLMDILDLLASINK